MACPIYLITFHSPLFAAHWSLWLPSHSHPTLGTIIHVQGSPSTGFSHEFKRNYDISTESRKHSVIFLCEADAGRVVDGAGDGAYSTDVIATDVLERWALAVEAPGPSLRSAGAAGSRARVELRNCQTWLREVVVVLVEKGVFPEEALGNLDRAPKN